MFFFPLGCLLFGLFLLALPVLFILGLLHVVTIGFESLGISSDTTLLLLLAILAGSAINIPLTRRKLFYKRRSLFDCFKRPGLKTEGIAINVGGAIIPVILSVYFLTKVSLMPALLTTILMIAISYFSARVIPGRGVSLPFFIPPIFSALLALGLAPNFAAPVAFISGVLGTLIGADLMHLNQAKQMGMVYIGGAGVFDGIFLVGIVAAVITSL